MNNINLVDFLSPAEIDAIKHQGRGCRKKEYWDKVTPEEKEKLLKDSFHSPEAKIKSEAATKERSWEQRRKISDSINKYFDGVMGTEEFKEIYRKRQFIVDSDYLFSVHSRASNAFWESEKGGEVKKYLGRIASSNWASKTPEEKSEWLKKSFHSGEARIKAIAAIPEGLRRYYRSLTPEEALERYKNSLGCEEALRNKVKNKSSGPTIPELVLGFYLEDKFPGIWAYNGHGEQDIKVGKRTPDFVRVDGTKEVIEELGYYWHPEEDFEKTISDYRNYGYKCTCIWEFDCFLPNELDKIFGNVQGAELPSGQNSSEPDFQSKEMSFLK